MDATIGATKIRYEDTGDPSRLPVVLIHAFPFSLEMWRPQIDALRERYRVVAYDVRGHGKSEVGDGQYTLEQFADDLFALLDLLRIPRAVLCGLSLGGYIALRAAEREPGRLRALVLCDTRSEADSNEAKLKRAAGLREIRERGVDAYAEALLPSLLAAGTLKSNPALVARARAWILANPPAGIRGALLALASRTDTTTSLGRIVAPTLLLVGAQDSLTPPSGMRALAGRIPGSRLHIVPEAGHLSSLENPAEFNKRLLAFLSGL